MRVTPSAIPAVLLIEPKVFGDERGFFFESWNRRALAEAGLDVDFVQDNHSRSARNVLRGLHYQVARPQGKLVRVTEGEVYDVAVDLRAASPTFGQHVALTLSAANRKMLWIPPGFAHGFCALTEEADLIYKCTALYDGKNDRSIAWDDPDIGIEWPIESPRLSPKDAVAPRLRDAAVLPRF